MGRFFNEMVLNKKFIKTKSVSRLENERKKFNETVRSEEKSLGDVLTAGISEPEVSVPVPNDQEHGKRRVGRPSKGDSR